MAPKTYEINGTEYRLEHLKLGQVGQLLDVMGDVEIMLDWSATKIASTLSGKLPKALAVVLTPKGEKPEDKDLDAIADEFAAHMDLAQAVEVIADFLSLNRVSSVYQNVIRARAALLASAAQQTNSGRSSADSAKATRANSGKLSGR